MSDFNRMIAPFARRIGNLFSRGAVSSSNGAGKMRTLQIRLLAGEVKDNVEHFEPYGFTSEPLPGAEHVSAFFDGDRSHGVTLIVADRRYRITGLKTGEMAIHDDQGQKVHLTRDGIVIHTAKKCRIEAADLELHASKSYSWDVAGYGERWTWVSGTTWEHKTWQTGATIVAAPQPIHPPEGP
jgi:phage baseplate assembly protein V